jgi:hypothetical protein
MNNVIKKISPALFSLGLFCFFLPFTTISCQQQQLATLNGVELAGGKEVKTPSILGSPSKTEKIPGEPLAALAILSGLVGLGGSFVRIKRSAIIPAGSAAAGFILLLMLKSKIDDAVVKEGAGLIVVSYGLGFWLTFMIYVSAMLVNIYSLIIEQNESETVKLAESNVSQDGENQN